MASGSALLEIGGSSADLAADEVEAFVRALVGDEERARRRPLMTAAPVLRLFGRQEATPASARHSSVTTLSERGQDRGSFGAHSKKGMLCGRRMQAPEYRSLSPEAAVENDVQLKPAGPLIGLVPC